MAPLRSILALALSAIVSADEREVGEIGTHMTAEQADMIESTFMEMDVMEDEDEDGDGISDINDEDENEASFLEGNDEDGDSGDSNQDQLLADEDFWMKDADEKLDAVPYVAGYEAFKDAYAQALMDMDAEGYQGEEQGEQIVEGSLIEEEEKEEGAEQNEGSLIEEEENEEGADQNEEDYLEEESAYESEDEAALLQDESADEESQEMEEVDADEMSDRQELQEIADEVDEADQEAAEEEQVQQE